MPGYAAQRPTLVRSGDHAAAIWAERGSGYEGVAVARYDFSTDTWSDPFSVFADSNPPFTPNHWIAIDADGDVAALWNEVIVGVWRLWVRIYDASAGTWGAAEQVTADPIQQLHGLSIEYDRDTGEPMVVFLSPRNARISVLFTKRGSSGWSAFVPLEDNDTDHVISASMRFVANDVGQALVSWVIQASGTPTHYLLPYDNEDFRRNLSNAFDPLSFTTVAGFGGRFPQIDLNNNGDGIWATDDSAFTDRELLGAMVDIDPASVTAPAIFHEGEASTSFRPGQTAIGDGGQSVVAWGQFEGSDTLSPRPWVSIYDGAWSAGQQVGTATIGTPGVKVDIDANGTATLLWSSGANGIFATRNTAAGRAFLPEQNLTGMVTASGQVQVVAHDSGDVLAVWHEFEDIRAGRCR